MNEFNNLTHTDDSQVQPADTGPFMRLIQTSQTENFLKQIATLIKEVGNRGTFPTRDAFLEEGGK